MVLNWNLVKKVYKIIVWNSKKKSKRKKTFLWYLLIVQKTVNDTLGCVNFLTFPNWHQFPPIVCLQRVRMIGVSYCLKTSENLSYQVSTRLTVETAIFNLQRFMRLECKSIVRFWIEQLTGLFCRALNESASSAYTTICFYFISHQFLFEIWFRRLNANAKFASYFCYAKESVIFYGQKCRLPCT